MKRVDDTGGKTFVQEKSQDVVAVMPGGFKSYFYFAQIRRCALEFFKKKVETIQIIRDREHIPEHFSVRVYDVTVVLVLGDINTNVDHELSSIV